MKLKSRLTIVLLGIIVLVIFTYVGYLSISKNNNNHEKISEETKSKITSIIKDSKGQISNLQADGCRAHWIDKAHIEQKEMMDKVLDTLTIVGESRKGRPSKFIIATFYDKMQVYIPYNEKTPHNNIVIEIDSRYFVATANEDDVRAIINYMEKQKVLQ